MTILTSAVISMMHLKQGDLVTAKDNSTPGTVLGLTAYVQYEGSYARVLFGDEVKIVKTSLLTKVEP